MVRSVGNQATIRISKCLTLFLVVTTIHISDFVCSGKWSDDSLLRYDLSLPEMDDDLVGGKISDLIIPFHPVQIQRAEALLSSWNSYSPCSEGKSTLESDSKIPSYEAVKEFGIKSNLQLGKQVRLTFLVSGGFNQHLQSRIEDRFNGLEDYAKDCFSSLNISFLNLRKKDNTYLRGSRLMFEHMLSNKIGLANPHYILYLEPDALPVRPGWLSVLDASTRWPNFPFWMKGSHFRGSPNSFTPSVWNMLHINGNAIYNLRDNNFREFYFRHVLNDIALNGSKVPYDHMIYRYLVDPNNYMYVRELGTKFQYTNYIHNVWHTTVELKQYLKVYPDVFIIHGANFTDRIQ